MAVPNSSGGASSWGGMGREGEQQASRPQHCKLAHRRGPQAPKLAEHVILAEFDIDSGSTVRHAYPHAVPGVSDDWFAEHMLPEGAHNHSMDWTVMFLNRRSKALDEDWPNDSNRDDGGGAGGGGGGGGGVDEAKRAKGAGLDPRDDARRRADARESRPQSGQKVEGDAQMGAARENEEGYFLYCINLVRKQDDPTVRRGAVVKAMCICSRYNFIEVFRPMLIVALEEYLQTPVLSVLESLFELLNSADISRVPRPTPWERSLMRRGVADTYMGSTPMEHLTSNWTHTITFGGSNQRKTQRAALPLYTYADETLNPSVTLLVNLFGQSVMTIYNAVLTGQRVLFVGYHHAAGDVCKVVLAACALVSPPLEGILRRAYPYASLSDLSFVEAPSYVAGVTNPMFESHPEWWDVLCQLDLPNGSGTVVVAEDAASEGGGSIKSRGAGASAAGSNSSNVTSGVSAGRPSAYPNAASSASSAPGTGASDPADSGGVQQQQHHIKELHFAGDTAFATRLLAGVKAGKGESWARCECHDYTQGLLNLALDRESGLVTELSASAGPFLKVLAANDGRLMQLKRAGSIRRRDVNPWARCRGVGGGPGAGGQGLRLRKYIRRLQLESNMNEPDTREAFHFLDSNLESEAELQVLAGLLPESKGGLGLLAMGLLSADCGTRRSAVTLLQKLEKFDSTRPALMCMNDFFQLAYERQSRQLHNPPGASPMPAPSAAGARAAGEGRAGSGGRGYGDLGSPRSVHE